MGAWNCTLNVTVLAVIDSTVGNLQIYSEMFDVVGALVMDSSVMAHNSSDISGSTFINVNLSVSGDNNKYDVI